MEGLLKLCGSCAHWKILTLQPMGSFQNIGRGPKGECRIRAPIVIQASDAWDRAVSKTCYPETWTDDWCGEYIHLSERVREVPPSINTQKGESL